MSEQQDNPKRSVIAPVVLAIIAAAVFGYAFYALEGLSLVDDLFGTSFSSEAAERDVPEVSTQQTALDLPEGMSEEFALRIWQEQIDSQANIQRLLNGDVERIDVDAVDESDDAATLSITVNFADGTSAPGRIGMSKLGDHWYFAYVSGMREEDTGGFADDTAQGTGEAPDSELPSLEEVDVPLLNTILEQQRASAAVLEEYATGAVVSVTISDIVDNPGTKTLNIVMNEDHEETRGSIVVVTKTVDGEDLWFIAKFEKDGGE